MRGANNSLNCERRCLPTPEPAPRSLIFYSSSLFHLSPVFNVWAKLTAQDIYSLQTKAGFGGQNTYFYLNHPIRWVRLVGVVISFQRFEDQGRVIIHLDDGSGKSIGLVHEDPDMPNRRYSPPVNAVDIDFCGIAVGSVLKVKGEISVFRGNRQITLRKIEVISDTNAEVRAWELSNAFKRNILHKPWVVSKEDIEQLRKEQRLRRRAKEDAAAARGRMHRDTSVELEPKPKVFRGKRREHRPENQPVKVKRERGVSTEPTSPVRKRVKRAGAIADRRIHEELQRLKIAGANTSNMDTRYRAWIKEGEEEEEEEEEDDGDDDDDAFAKSWLKRDYTKTDWENKPIKERTHSTRERSARDHDCSGNSLASSTASVSSRFSSPPDPEEYSYRSLKLKILDYIYSTPMPKFSVANLRIIPAIESYTTKVAMAQNPTELTSNSGLIFQTYCIVLEILVQDGNIIRIPPTAHSYTTVGRWNLGDLIQEAITTAKEKAMRKLAGVEAWQRPLYGAYTPITGKISVRSIWQKAIKRGGGWAGVTKGVVADVVKEVLEEEGGWRDLGDLTWEWEDDTSISSKISV